MNAGNEQDRRDHGEAFHDVVLAVCDLGLVVVAYTGQEVTGQVEPVGGRAVACRTRRQSAARHLFGPAVGKGRCVVAEHGVEQLSSRERTPIVAKMALR